ncbi:MAG: hypothetical protein GX541_03945 [Clostridiales bacterium]|nr:hypothetical protein [Clostridiales bacterium]
MPDGKALFNIVSKLAVKYKYLLVIIAAGLLLLILPGRPESESRAVRHAAQNDFSVEEYEEKIEEVLGKCHGVGRVSVMLAVKSGMETVYAEEERVSTREQQGSDINDYNVDRDVRPSILSDGSGRELPVTVKQVYPEFLGAAVVCDGADNPNVRLYITEAVSSLTGISSDRISVIKMKY